MRIRIIVGILCFYFASVTAQPDLSTPSECLRSIEVYKHKVKENPDNTYAYFVLATAHFRLQDADHIKEAIKMWDKLIAIDETYEGAYYQRGYCKLFLEDYEGACIDWQKSIELGYNPSNAYNRKSLSEGVKELCGIMDEEIRIRNIVVKDN